MIYAGRFQDRAAVITGGASGLGLETAKRITAEGGKVCLWDLDADALAAAKKESGAIHSIALDVSDAKAVKPPPRIPAKPWARSISWSTAPALPAPPTPSSAIPSTAGSR